MSRRHSRRSNPTPRVGVRVRVRVRVRLSFRFRVRARARVWVRVSDEQDFYLNEPKAVEKLEHNP